MYPMLMRLDRGLLETAWEADRQPGRPPRHLYRPAVAAATARSLWPQGTNGGVPTGS
jgi:hypothetical protein